ncbi:MAG: thioredoxin domain-containing protein [Acidimicrobiaceae bacterium]|nr:thioredoxin domain-containing protein [Acidimicrobiaceae bacterium]
MTNRLKNESSLYLRQHMSNPVDWWPYCEEAFEEAKKRGVPVFISIGYAACHWCHVMEKECFEDSEVAEKLNGGFVSIKVDREERPDVDALYMEALQAMSGSGGWPMSIFATPEKKPFYAGTYFPKLPSRNMPGFISVLEAVSSAYADQKSEVESVAQEMISAIRTRTTLPKPDFAAADLDALALLDHIAKELTDRADKDWGGFGLAPKFPQPHLIALLLRHHYLTGDNLSLNTAKSALDHMASGGIFDHLGGGFARYSVDRFWIVPHFEKMLYDQAGLLKVYAEAYSVTKDENYAYVAKKIASYVDEALKLQSGGLASSQDADSDGEEGAYYIFRIEEVKEVLGGKAKEFIEFYGVSKSGNFEGRNILHRPHGKSIVPTESIAESNQKLLEYRKLRNPPARDDKVVCEYNAQYGGALITAGRLMMDSELMANGVKLVDLLNERLLDPTSGRLKRVLFGMSPSIDAMAADYFWLALANIEAYGATGQADYLRQAALLCDKSIEHFWDNGGCGFFTSENPSDLDIPRTKDIYDTATISTNAIASEVLLKLGYLTDNSSYLDRADELIATLANAISSAPSSFGWVAWSARLLNGGLRELVIPGPLGNFAPVFFDKFFPDTISLFGDRSASPLFLNRDDSWAYLCVGNVCNLPTQDPQVLKDQLSQDRWLVDSGSIL